MFWKKLFQSMTNVLFIPVNSSCVCIKMKNKDKNNYIITSINATIVKNVNNSVMIYS